jgi:hypothetical protein
MWPEIKESRVDELLVQLVEVCLGQIAALGEEEAGENALRVHDANPQCGSGRVEAGVERPRVPAEEGDLGRRDCRVRRDRLLPADQLHEVHANGRKVFMKGHQIESPDDRIRHRHGEVIAVDEAVDVRVEGVLDVIVLKSENEEGAEQQLLVE